MSGNAGFEPVSAASEEAKQAASAPARELEAVYDIPVQISAVLGRATMQVSQLLKLGRGAVVELDRKLGEMRRPPMFADPPHPEGDSGSAGRN